MGLMIVVSRLGAASAPWIAQYLMAVHEVLPFTVMGGMGVIAGILCFKLRETNGQPTAETLGNEIEGKFRIPASTFSFPFFCHFFVSFHTRITLVKILRFFRFLGFTIVKYVFK